MKKSATFIEGLTNILRKQQVLSPDDAKHIKKLFHDRSEEAFDDFLIAEGLVTRPVLLNALSAYYNVPAFDVEGFFFDHHLLREFPEDFLVSNSIIPLERDENTLIVVAGNPADEELLPKIGKFVSYDIQFMVGIGQDIVDAIEEFYEMSVSEVAQDEDTRVEREEYDHARHIIYPDEPSEEE